MTKVSPQHKPDPVLVKREILRNRNHFSTYNIARLRELIRHLPEEKLELFHTIPILLHINSPDLPGYVDHPQTPYGIHRFYGSGFWKLAKKRVGIERKNLGSISSKSFFIKGVYLMGSTGTIGQTDYSDFDYWVVIDTGSLNDEQRALLQTKLAKIKDWGRQAYDHDLTLFVVDLEQVRQNDFSGVYGQGSGPTQKSLLKEEFYRTFIMIAGQIPYWAVLPTGLSDAEYNAWVKQASLLSDDDFEPYDYVDIGNLTAIKGEECSEAVLWQICDSRKDPAKALIKASLIAHDYSFQERDGLLCNSIKTRFSERRLDSYLLDPYLLAFERAISFYKSMGDRDGLDLAKECVYLRLRGYLAPSQLDENHPKRQILRRYAKEWSWSRNRVNRLESYDSWTEQEKLKFEGRILDRLSSLYELIFRTAGKARPLMDVPFDGLDVLKSRTSSPFKKKPAKVPRCSAYIRARRDSCALFITCGEDESGANSWFVYDHSSSGRTSKKAPLFSARELLRVLGWVVFNGLYGGKASGVVFQHVQSVVLPNRAKRLLQDLYGFFSDEAELISYMHSDPVWLKVFVAPNGDLISGDNTLRSADYLIQNTWGEIFYYSLGLKHIENNLLKCHNIAKQIWQYMQKAVPEGCEYRIRDFRTMHGAATVRTIKDFVKSLQEPGSEDLKAQDAIEKQRLQQDDTKSKGLLLDLF
jgi:adenylate cyclase class 1